MSPPIFLMTALIIGNLKPEFINSGPACDSGPWKLEKRDSAFDLGMLIPKSVITIFTLSASCFVSSDTVPPLGDTFMDCVRSCDITPDSLAESPEAELKVCRNLVLISTFLTSACG
ncbi:MAG: hypothetical protein BWY84_00733 [Candidatus Aerophobetes bacterium ADurb.Bin490]|nr:MAG: hypothetical protein BWY84_00733 [Candidatus Aerophobetes bacterium ADurb.Bin490]